MTDAEIMRRLAGLMGWEVYENYPVWLAQIVAKKSDGTCYIDGAVWCYSEGEVEWRPLEDMNDAMMIVKHLWKARRLTTQIDYQGDSSVVYLVPENSSVWEYRAEAETPERAIALVVLATEESPHASD